MKLFFTKDKLQKEGRGEYFFYDLVINKRGFSLIEISVVLLILGILVAVAIPLFSDQKTRANKTVCHSRLYELRTAEEASNMLHGSHTEEYTDETALREDSKLLEFFDNDNTVTCPQTGQFYFWSTRDGVKMLFCPEHGTDNPAVITNPQSVLISVKLFLEMVQDYTEDRITYLEFSKRGHWMSMGADLVYGSDGADVIRGRAGRDLLNGGDGDDRLYGNRHNDGLFGGAGNDYLNGGNGNDLLHGGEGDDKIDGGNGNDTVIFDKPRDAYTIKRINRNSFYITDKKTGEMDRVRRVENFQFGDDEVITIKELIKS